MVTVGIIGAGRIGKVHTESISNYVRNARIKTVADPFMNDATAQWMKSMGVENTCTDYHEILNDPEIQAVLICSSTKTPSPISLEAIAAGKHVFCEKPIDHDLSKIKKVVEALKGSNIKYQVGFNRRFDHNHGKVLASAITLLNPAGSFISVHLAEIAATADSVSLRSPSTPARHVSSSSSARSRHFRSVSSRNEGRT